MERSQKLVNFLERGTSLRKGGKLGFNATCQNDVLPDRKLYRLLIANDDCF